MTTTAADLQAQYDDPWNALADVQTRLNEKDERIDDLEATVTKQAEMIDRQHERIEELESDVHTAELSGESAYNHASSAHARISELEDQIDNLRARGTGSGESADNPDGNGDTDGADATKTPLETICALPEHVAARELTANQERARFIATDVRDYAEKAPAGLVIDSRAIKRVIAAKEGDRPHTQTVARIMEFLDRLGKDAVELRKRRGRKLVAIDPEAADRLSALAEAGANHDRCDRGSRTGPTESVIGSV